MRPIVAFVALTFAVSWLLWFAAAATMGWDVSLASAWSGSISSSPVSLSLLRSQATACRSS